MEAIEASLRIAASREAAFSFLADLHNHWLLADRWLELRELEQPGDGGPALGGAVRLRAPWGLRRTVITRVVVRELPATDAEPARVEGEARVGPRTRARIAWTLTTEPFSSGGDETDVDEDALPPVVGGSGTHVDTGATATRVGLRAEVLDATLADRAILALGGAWWLRRRFGATLERLAAELHERPAGVEAVAGAASAPDV